MGLKHLIVIITLQLTISPTCQMRTSTDQTFVLGQRGDKLPEPSGPVSSFTKQGAEGLIRRLKKPYELGKMEWAPCVKCAPSPGTREPG